LTIAIVVWEHLVGPLPTERWMVAHLSHRLDKHAAFGELASFLSYVGGLGVAVPTLVAVTWFTRQRFGNKWAALVPLTLVPGWVAQVVKVTTNATELAKSSGQVSLENGSLPSGHAAYVTSLFGLIAFLAWTRGQKDIAALALALILAVGIALIVRGSHFPGDVLAGFALGAGWTLTCILATVRLRLSSGLQPPV
jgi:membrane-associated phospholipid phosphatase